MLLASRHFEALFKDRALDLRLILTFLISIIDKSTLNEKLEKMSNKSANGVGSLVNEEHELATNSLDFFSMPPTESAQVVGRDHTIYMTTPLTDEGPYEFIVNNDSTDFIQLDHTYLIGEVEVVGKADGVLLKAADKSTSIVNNFPQTLFKQIELYLNGVCVSDLSTPTYAYKAYLENHLSYGKDIKDTTLLARELYLKDTAGKEGPVVADYVSTNADSGIGKRAKYAHQTICFNMKPHIDFLGSVKYLVPGVEMRLKLIRNSDSFSIMSKSDDYKIKFKKLELKVRRIVLQPQYYEAVEKGLTAEPAKYPIAMSKIKQYLINAGVVNAYIPQIIRGKIPRSFIFGFVEAESYDGAVANNPFTFKNMDITNLNVYLNGEPLHPNALSPKWEGMQCVSEYVRFLDNIGMHQNHTNDISIEDFKANTCLFAYDMSPDLCNSFYKHETESGELTISVAFKNALAKNTYLVLYSTYDEVVVIDKNRQVAITN